MRTCGGCKRKGENEEFIRFILFEGKLLPDVARKLPGRGFNVCPNYECIKQFVKKKFREKVDPEEVYKTALKALKDYFLRLLSLCHKTGITVIGQDNVKKLPPNREGILILSSDLSPGTKKRLKRGKWLILEDAFSSEEIGGALKRGARIGALFVEKVGLGRKLYSIARKLVNLEGKDG